jgi:L-lactate dehydrogenase complex protein LldG
MSSARSAILDRLRRASRTGRIPSDWAHPPDAVPSTVTDPLALRDRFVRELDALGVSSHVAMSADDVRRLAAAIIGDRVVFSWDPERLPYEVGRILQAPLTGASSRADQARAEIGVTGCHAAIAETGSVAVLSGAGMPRAASLLPPAHLCIVRTADLFASIAAFFSARSQDISTAACCTFITGPSRTADIELTLTLGVHGPGEVIVVIGP